MYNHIRNQLPGTWYPLPVMRVRYQVPGTRYEVLLLVLVWYLYVSMYPYLCVCNAGMYDQTHVKKAFACYERYDFRQHSQKDLGLI